MTTHSSGSSPVTASIRGLSAGPTAQDVAVPGVTCVRPASCASSTGSSPGRLLQMFPCRHLEDYLGLSLPEPAGEAGAVAVSLGRGDGGMGHLRGDLASSRTEIDRKSVV